MQVFALNESLHLGQGIAASIGIDLSELEHRDFSDGESKIRPMVSVRGQDVYVVQSLFAEPDLGVHDKLGRLLFLIATMRDHGAARVTAVVPYLAYARKDRRTKPRDPLTTRYVAQLFEAVRCDCIVTLEVHNTAAFENAFRCQTVHLELGDVFREKMSWQDDSQRLVVVSPDPGGVKRAQLFREALEQRLGQPVGFGFMDKRRSAGLMTHGEMTGDFAGASVLIVDDMIASGGTMLTAAGECRQRGAAKVYAMAAHGLFTGDTTALFSGDLIERVFVTDSIAPYRLPLGDKTARFEIATTAQVFADTVKRLSIGQR
ncbi:ribose-phosphate diphosphokinase [Puniceibacterium sediminis]|uniref:ribose-phosphate diphosphokinase n=1 Tax=Puniceibacterium sediminis TaxID=1608407 RepID=A0A238ZDE9_9RHOB|nr:ribose-phosphate diphosphokinase [Puniceibacterium sediminis]SNR81367.1 ribose-phosphate pyrophosphokinase [Puniceibacterium sediminis]